MMQWSSTVSLFCSIPVAVSCVSLSTMSSCECMCNTSVWFHTGHWSIVINQAGPCFQSTEESSDAALIPLVSKSAGLSAVGQYLHAVGMNSSLISCTRLATNGFSVLWLCSQ